MPDDPIPYGYCQCGCGEKTHPSGSSHAPRGYVKGEPRRFLHGHSGRNVDRRGLLGEGYFVIRDCGYETPCWVWIRALDQKGYGISYSATRKRQYKAHRVVYEQRVGLIPEGMIPHHLCFNHSCVNPQHLQIITPLQNSPLRLDAKLNDDDRREIVRLKESGVSKNRISKQFGVTMRVIDNVLRRPPPGAPALEMGRPS